MANVRCKNVGKSIEKEVHNQEGLLGEKLRDLKRALVPPAAELDRHGLFLFVVVLLFGHARVDDLVCRLEHTLKQARSITSDSCRCQR